MPIIARTYVCGDLGSVKRLDNLNGVTVTGINPNWVNVSLLAGGISGGNGFTLYDIETDPTNGDKVIAVGEMNPAINPNYFGIAVSNNGGVTWNIPGGNYITLINFGYIPVFREVTYVDTNTIYACVESGFVVKSIDGGLTFNICATLPPRVFETWSIHFISPTTGVVGCNDEVIFTNDGGATWSTLNGGQTFTATGTPLGRVVGILMNSTGTSITALGETGIALSVDSGLTFPAVPPPSATAPFPLSSTGRHLTWFGNGAGTVITTVSNGTTYTGNAGYTNGALIINGGAMGGTDVLAAHIHTNTSGFIAGTLLGSSQLFYSSNQFSTVILQDAWNNTIQAVWTYYLETPDPVCYLLTNCLTQNTIVTSSDLSAVVGQIVNINEQSGCWSVSVAPNCDNAIPVTVTGPAYHDCNECLPTPSGCYCPEGYTLNADTGYCEQITSTPAVINNPIALEKSLDSPLACIWGAVIYPDITTLPKPITSDPLVGVPTSPAGSGIYPYFSYPQLRDATLAPLLQTGIISPTPTNSTWGWAFFPTPIPPFPGRLNAAGVWPAGYPQDTVWGIDMCVSIPATQTYIIGVAADDAFRLYLNNQLIVDTFNTGFNFNCWYMFPITLVAGNNTFKLEAIDAGVNRAAAFEIYNASFAQLQAVANPGALIPYIVYTTANLVGQNITSGVNTGYSCGNGCQINLCNNPVTCECRSIVEPLPCCYVLSDCQGIQPDFYTSTDLSTYLQGPIIQVAEFPGVCWAVALSDQACPGQPAVTVSGIFQTCEACLPTPPPPPTPTPYELRPRKIKPGYDTPGCDPEYTQKVDCTFGSQVYDEMVKKRYGITICCEQDVDKWDIKKELLDLKALYDPELCRSTLATCCPPCGVEVTLTVYTPGLACPPPANVDVEISLDPIDCPEPTAVQAGISLVQ